MKFTEIQPKSRNNYLGVQGWAWGGRYGVERYLYTLQRITGLGVLLYLPMHLIVTGQKLDPQSWQAVMARVMTWPLPIGEFLVFVGGVFHALNGIRLLLTHFGFLMASPARPIYPFTVAALKQRWAVYLMLTATTVVVGYGAYEFFLISQH
ncbi:MAG TPA: hypothetical protein VJ417_10605 [Candidatus Glassbacteria bacterium]|nr:hypothetical protein [Candidatus Glassbacteria bacterium]